MTSGNRYIVLSVPDLAVLKRSETILKHEARARSTTVGWAFYLLVNEAVDVESYPDELGERIKLAREAEDAQYAESAKRRFGGRTKPVSESSVSSRDSTYRIQFATAECYRVVRATLAYESVVRGLTASQAACFLVEKAARAWSYPEEVLIQLDKIGRELAAHAVGSSMAVLEGSRENGKPGKRTRR